MLKGLDDQESVTNNKRVTENIMPLELAIERELAYRTRVDELRKRTRLELRKARVQSQISASILSRSPVEKKRKTSFTSGTDFPHQLSHASGQLKSFQTNILHCKICNVPCSGMTSWKQHLAGKKHAACVKEREIAKRTKEEAGKIIQDKWDKMEWEMVA